jgi:hypothetical protein
MQINHFLLISSLLLFSIQSFAKSEESFSEKDCKKADNYSVNFLQKIAEGIGAPEKSIRFEGTFIGGPVGGCTALIATPKGPYNCSVSTYTSDGGRTFFIGIPSAGLMAGMHNLCERAK